MERSDATFPSLIVICVSNAALDKMGDLLYISLCSIVYPILRGFPMPTVEYLTALVQGAYPELSAEKQREKVQALIAAWQHPHFN